MTLYPVNIPPIPKLMKLQSSWINWLAGDPDSNGKFAKYPINAINRYKVDAHNPTNQIEFDLALRLSQSDINIGIGYVLNGKPILANDDSEFLFLVGIDIDKKAGLTQQNIKDIWRNLGEPYMEVSPSRTGIRIFCLSKELLPNRNCNGLEIYTSGRFLTVTGWSGQGELIECTDQIKTLHQEWFPIRSTQPEASSNNMDRYPPPDTPRNRAWVNELLSYIDPDCDYETYRNVVWAIEDIGWKDSEYIGRNWSLGAPERFSEDAFTVIRSSFDGRRDGITFGSLVFYAKIGGWNATPNRRGAW